MTGDAALHSRRQVLVTGGLTLTFGSLAAACGSGGGPEPVAVPEVETTSEEADGASTDLAALNTALSLEVLIFDAYQAASDFGLVQSSEVTDALALFQQHHREHRDTLIALVEAAGGEPFTTANPVVKAALVDPTLLSVTEERDFVRLAHDLEQSSTQLYVHTVTTLSTPELRSAAMSIGGAASRRATILDLLGDLAKERRPVYSTENPLPSDAIVTG